MSSENHSRVIVHLDIDAFYAQVEENCQPELKTKPLGVYQKTIIVTSNYVAREYGIKKCMLTTEAIKLCPNLVLVNGENLEKYRQISQDITRFIQEKYKVPVEKLGFDENFVDITKLVEEKIGSHTHWDHVQPRNSPSSEDDDDNFGVNSYGHTIHVNKQSKNNSLKRKCESANLEHNLENVKKKAKLNSLELEGELFTQTEDSEDVANIEHGKRKSCNFTRVVGHVYKGIPGKCSCGCIHRITIGTHIANDIRLDIFKQYNLTLSGGISCNKLLSKLVGSLHKPNQQTVIYPNAALDLMSNIQLRQIPGIGSKMVEKLATNLNIKTVEQLQNASKANLCKTFDATTADWLLNVCYGKDVSQIKNFSKQSSIGVEDRYAKPVTSLEEYIRECKVLLARLLILVKKDGRVPRLLKLHLRFDHFKFEWKLDSKQCQISSSAFSNADQADNYLIDVLVKLYKELCLKRNSRTVTYINIALGNFIDIASSENSILKFCQNKTNKIGSIEHTESSNKDDKEYETPKVSTCSTIHSTNPCQRDDDTHTNKDETVNHPATVDSELKAGQIEEENNTGSGKSYQSTSSSGTDTYNSAASPIEANNSYSRLDVTTIDRSVLNELPDDIREEIERELLRHDRGTGSQNQVQRNSENHMKTVDGQNKPKKTVIKQLSMLNFVQKK